METSKPTRLRILLADDHDLVRRGVRVMLEREPGWEVCGVAETGPQAVKEARRLQPDIVVVDLEMPGFGGIEVTRRIKRHLPATEILVYTGSPEVDDVIRDVFASGAKSYLNKTDASAYLIEALRSLAEHKFYFTEKTSAVMFARFTHAQKGSPGDTTASDERLSESEKELIRLLADGHSNASVARKQRVSVRTIENMRAGIMGKLKLDSFADLVRYAARNGIIKT